MLNRSLLLVVGMCISQSAAAVCYYEGKAYPTGAQIRGYVCMPDGRWKRVARRVEQPVFVVPAHYSSFPREAGTWRR